jgi:hypothetical protein
MEQMGIGNMLTYQTWKSRNFEALQYRPRTLPAEILTFTQLPSTLRIVFRTSTHNRHVKLSTGLHLLPAMSGPEMYNNQYVQPLSR